MVKRKHLFLFSLVFVLFSFMSFAQQGLSPQDLLQIKNISEVAISPDGNWIAYTVSTPRQAGEEPGSAYGELYLVSPAGGPARPFITGKVNVRQLRWHPDSRKLAFLTSREKGSKTQIWQISVTGGEAIQITDVDSGINNFEWHPNGGQIAYTCETPETKREKELAKKGYHFIVYEEDTKQEELFLYDPKTKKSQPLTKEQTVWDFVFNATGDKIALIYSRQNLADHSYMFKKIAILDLSSKHQVILRDEVGKIGNVEFSPDSTRITFTASLEAKDHQVSQVYIQDIKSKEIKNLTIPNFAGHVTWASWKDNNTVMYLAGEGTVSTLNLVPAQGGKRQVVFSSAQTGIVFNSLSMTKEKKDYAFRGSSPLIPGDLFYWDGKKKVKRLTEVNPFFSQRLLGRQEVIQYQARDNWKIEGILIYPVNFNQGNTYPLIVLVHGGPEHHYYNSWVSSYGYPGQVLAANGYLVFYPNYRASTGYGTRFALAGYGDAAGKEFDDIADGIDFLINKGLADKNRVGLGGGSYGGYASAWFATYYTRYVRAVCMSVGISDLISKQGTTDIPYEEYYVHSGQKLEKMWQFSLERSPIYWAHQSKTAVLIMGGTIDTRVHPSQSLELYRRLKMNDHPAVRLVQYPGEGHGNRRQPGQIDSLYRSLQWYDWYVKDAKPLDGPMPGADISAMYGLELPE